MLSLWCCLQQFKILVNIQVAIFPFVAYAFHIDNEEPATCDPEVGGLFPFSLPWGDVERADQGLVVIVGLGEGAEL